MSVARRFTDEEHARPSARAQIYSNKETIMKKKLLALCIIIGTAQPGYAQEVHASWQGIKTKSISRNAVACLAIAITGTINRFGFWNLEVFTPWFGGEARWYVPSGQSIFITPPGSPSTKMAVYTAASDTVNYQTIAYRSINGRYSQCVIDKVRGEAVWTGEF